MPSDSPSILLLIPAYTEESRIGPVLGEYALYFREHHPDNFRVVIVLNGCTDDTLVVVDLNLSGLHVNLSGLHVFSLPHDGAGDATLAPVGFLQFGRHGALHCRLYAAPGGGLGSAGVLHGLAAPSLGGAERGLGFVSSPAVLGLSAPAVSCSSLRCP